MVKVLNNNTTLQELDFSKNNISTKGAASISESLQYNVTLQQLKISWKSYFINTDHSTIILSHKYIKDSDARIVANILCSNKTVTKLDLSQNKVSDYGAEGLGSCIKINKSLKEINLSRNKISNVGIAVALKNNQTLQKLDISHNNLSGKGPLAIGECLRLITH